MLSENEFRHCSIIAPSLVAMDFRDEAILHSQGNRLAHLFWLLKGVVKLSHLIERGAAQTIAVLGPGNALGTTLPNEVLEHSATALGIFASPGLPMKT